MKNIQFTISKKLLFIFLINSFVTIIITGLVIQSFTDISESIKFTSKSFSFFKSNLDYIRLEQEKLKNTNLLIDASIENALKTKNKLIQSSDGFKEINEHYLNSIFSEAPNTTLFIDDKNILSLTEFNVILCDDKNICEFS